jgi:hypothetical protein
MEYYFRFSQADWPHPCGPTATLFDRKQKHHLNLLPYQQ